MEQNQSKEEFIDSKFNHNLEDTIIDHSKLILNRLESLYLNEEFSDIILILKDKEQIPAHKVILASSSDYFRALLFGGLQESKSDKINLKCENIELFKLLLKYVYTGQINLINLNIQQLQELFQMSHEYNFKNLNETISTYLISILNLDNVCIFYDLSNFYDIDELRIACIKFLDSNAEQVLKQSNFINLSKSSLESFLLRDSLCASELSILIGLNKWIQANGPVDKDSKELYKLIRMNLINIEQLIDQIRSSELLTSDEILDIIHSTVKNKEKNYRCFTIPETNIATTKFETKVIHGELKILNNGNNMNKSQLDKYEDDQLEHREIVSNLIKPNEETCLLIQFKYPYKINLIKMNLNSKDDRSFSYYIEISLDAENWKRVIDYTEFICRAQQFLYFNAEVVKYVKVVAKTCNNCDQLEVTSIECIYTNETYELYKGFIKPKKNIATIDKSAQVIEGISRIKDVLLFGDKFICDPDISFTCHQIGNRPITIQLAQPYMINSLRFLLYDNDKCKYSYEVYVSGDNKKWIKVATESKKRSWQVIKFDEPIPVCFISLKGTYCSVNQALNVLKFECPSSV